MTTLLAAALAAVGVPPLFAAPSPPNARVDHVILGVSDLEVGIAQFAARTGVEPLRGGVHPQYGTQNALVAAGPKQYIEILAPAPGARLAPFLEPLRSFSTLTPIAWVVEPSDFQATASWLQSFGFAMMPEAPGTRVQADGSVLRWTLLSPNPAVEPTLPSLIRWDPASPHPAEQLTARIGLVALRIRDPRPERISALIELLGLPVEVEPNQRPGLEVLLSTPSGNIRF